MEMEGDSDITDLNSEGIFKSLDQIEEKALSILDSSLQFDYMVDSLEKKEERLRVVEAREKEIGLLEESVSGKVRVLEEKEMYSDLIQVTVASLMRLVIEKQTEEVVNQLKKQENKLGLLCYSVTKKLEDVTSEFEGKKEESLLIFESINEKLCELDKAEKDFDLKQKVATERRNVEIKQLDARKNELILLEEDIKEKSVELKRKEENFELKQKEEADQWREETELKSKDLAVKEKTLEEMMKELELKHMELEERLKQQLVNAETRKRTNLELEPLVPLLVENDSEAGSLTPLAKKHKSQEAGLACAPFGNTDPSSQLMSKENDGDIEGIVCKDKSDEDPKPSTCLDTKFNDFGKSMSSFAVDQVWALYDPRDDMPRIYAQIRKIFSSQLSLQVTILEHVKTTKYKKSILSSACGRFEYGDTEIKSHLMFAHEMDHIKCDKNVIVNPRKGETWALFRDWDISWNSHSDLHEPPYRYDFVEVISEFDDRIGISVAYMRRVEGFASVSNHAEQHGLIKIKIIYPGEMQRFSHKVAQVKLRGEEKEDDVPPGSYKLDPAATQGYDPVLEEVEETSIRSKDFGKSPTVENQEGSTKDKPIIIE